MNIIRNHKKGTVIGTVIGLVLAAGIAVALFLLTAPITGSVSSAKIGVDWTPGINPNPTGVVCTGGTVGTITTGAPNLNVTMDKAYPGDSCIFTAAARTAMGSNEDAKIMKLVMPNLPEGWTVGLTTPCGTTLVDAATNAVGETTPVKFKVMMTETAANGSGGSLTGAALQAVPASQFAASMCN